MTEQEHVISLLRNTQTVVKQQQLGEATSQVQYDSNGHALIIGNATQALQVAADFKQFGATVVEVDAAVGQTTKKLTEDGIAVFTVPELSLHGYLGAFSARVPASKTDARDFDLAVSVYLQSGCFDVVLDLSEKPCIATMLPPFGYRHAQTQQQIEEAVELLSDMQGEFDKPRYFDYQQNICAHSRSELEGCRLCMDACAAGAIVSSGEGVSVDPFLCQGCGSCATVCPSGAMSYAYPRPANAIDRTRQLLGTSKACAIVLYAEDHKALVDAATPDPAVLTLEVEEVTAFGADYWLSMLAGGVCRIILLTDTEAHPDDPGRQAIVGQIALVHQLMAGLGVDEPVVQLLDSKVLSEGGSTISVLSADNWQDSPLRSIKPAQFATHNDKRQTLRLALDALSEQLSPAEPVISLQAGAPFGRVNVDAQACTLCLSCVSICPAKALQEGQGTPALRFVEANCLQCGLCETACPESAISLQAQFMWDSIRARRVETLHEEEPFHCLLCHTAFSTRAMIDAMSEKLTGHWMFQDPKALRRLKMCGDCRVRDMFEDDQKGIDVHKPA